MAGRSCSPVLVILIVLKLTIAQEPSLTLMPETIQKNLGANVYVSCSANVPNPELVTNMEWRGPNYKIIPTEDGAITTLNGTGPNQLELFIKELKRKDAGSYNCSAIYAGNNKLSKTIEVEFYRDIDFQDTEPVQTPVLNSDAKIRCMVTADPAPIVDWLKGGVLITDTTDKRIIIQSDGLLIKNIQENDEGVYRCRARVPALGELKFMNIQVEVHVPPVITGEPKDTSGVEKESVSFLCVASGKPAPVYTWVNKDSEVLQNKEGYFVDDRTGELKILDLRPEHAGKYRCSAKNAAGEVFAEANLRVLMKPKVERYLNITVAENEEAEMRCILTGDPLPEVIFQKETNPEPFKNGVNGDGRIQVQQTQDDEGRRIGILRISSLARRDDGLYTCTGNSTGGKTVAWGHITVEFKPTFEDQPQNEFWSWEQKPVNLTCLATSIPNATVQWYLREDPVREQDPNIEVLSRGPNGVLRIHPVDGSYFDTYTCQATNKLGVTDHDVALRQVQKPGPVSSTQVDKKTATTISWNIRDPLSDGGLPVLGYSVQFRLADTSWEKSQKLFWSKGSSYVVDKLTPLATYVFRFAARNDVGDGEWSGEKSIEMPKRSFPEEPLIYTVNPNKVKNIPYTDHYDLQWKVPLDNGEPIQFFEINYYQVRNASKSWELVGSKKEIKIPYPGDSKYKLEDLNSNTYYKIELRAENKIGFSTPAEAIIKTAYDPASPSGNKPGPSVKFSSVATPTPSNAPVASVTDEKEDSKNVGLIIGIIIIGILILLIIIDVILFFAKNVGLTAFLVSKLTAKPSEKDKEAMIEDGTKSPKADDNSNREMDKVKDSSKEKDCNETTPMITGNFGGSKRKGRQESRSLFNVFAVDDDGGEFANESFDSNVTFNILPGNPLSKSQPTLNGPKEISFCERVSRDKYFCSDGPPLPPKKKNLKTFKPQLMKGSGYYVDGSPKIYDRSQNAVLIAPYHRNREYKDFNNKNLDMKPLNLTKKERNLIETAFKIAPYNAMLDMPKELTIESSIGQPVEHFDNLPEKFPFVTQSPYHGISTRHTNAPHTPAQYRKLVCPRKAPSEQLATPPIPLRSRETEVAYFIAPYHRNASKLDKEVSSNESESSWDSLESCKEFPLNDIESRGGRFINSKTYRIRSFYDLTGTNHHSSSHNNSFNACSNLTARSLDNILHGASQHARSYKQPTRI